MGVLITYLKIKEKGYEMNKSFFYKGLFVILIGIGLSSQSNAAAPAYDNAAKAGDIVGQLNMCSGSNEGLRVYIPGSSFEAITGSIGNFKISYAQPGTYNLTVMQGGNKIGIIPDVTVIAKQTLDVGTVPFCLDNDNDGYTQDVDCNDNNPAIHPGSVEVCEDGIDNNCNGETDEGCPTCTDNDGDEFSVGEGCTGGIDCDDNNALIFPGAYEKCNGVDDNCDGQIDENAIDQQTFYIDDDNDEYGDSSNTVTACEQPQGYIGVSGDCDDLNAAVNPGATEVCGDGIDNNCDAGIDEGCPTCTDADADNYFAEEECGTAVDLNDGDANINICLTPQVSSMQPNTVPAGFNGLITIYGSNFSYLTEVRLGDLVTHTSPAEDGTRLDVYIGSPTEPGAYTLFIRYYPGCDYYPTTRKLFVE